MEYFDRYLSAANVIYANSTKKILLVDQNSRIKYLSPFFGNEIDLKDSDVIGNSYDSIPQIKPLAGACMSEDLECLENGTTLKFITLHNHNGESNLFYKIKSPIFDIQKNILGIQIEFEPVSAQLNSIRSFINQNLLKFNIETLRIDNGTGNNTSLHGLQKLCLSKKLTNKDVKFPTLTQTEHLILFLLLMYDKPKIVTNIVNQIMNKDVSVSTIRNIIHQQLMVKFEVTNTQELIDRSINLGYEARIPSLIAKPFSIKI